jgi:hypothetical protein
MDGDILMDMQEIKLFVGVMAPFFILSVLIISMYYLGGDDGE